MQLQPVCPSNGRQYGSLKHPSKAHARLQVSCPWQAQLVVQLKRSGSGACRGWSVGSLGGRKMIRWLARSVIYQGSEGSEGKRSWVRQVGTCWWTNLGLELALEKLPLDRLASPFRITRSARFLHTLFQSSTWTCVSQSSTQRELFSTQ